MDTPVTRQPTEPPARGGEHLLVRRAADSEAWRSVKNSTKERLAALEEEAARGLDDEDFEAKLAELVKADPVLRAVVSGLRQHGPDTERGVQQVPGATPKVNLWKCPNSGCTEKPVPGTYTSPIGATTCAKHPSQTLVRVP
ncbi:hypothetical protein [Frankia sp. CiP3]|uniref:hypothetical protein n=1 Tax=Frankia sp. CiP3 TaxID=2880971 RepID=UPI001EF5A003|nr:hypothetical protein [Frankia sp. CiP3]